MQIKDERCWRYRKGVDGNMEQRIFTSPRDVPPRQGWTDSPARIVDWDASTSNQLVDTEIAKATQVLSEAIQERDDANAALNTAIAEIPLEDMDKDALIALAQERGIQIDKRWSVSRIVEHIQGGE